MDLPSGRSRRTGILGVIAMLTIPLSLFVACSSDSGGGGGADDDDEPSDGADSDITLFADSNFVDYPDEESDLSDFSHDASASHEAYNMEQGIIAAGHEVKLFRNASSESWANIRQDHSLLIIPEQEVDAVQETIDSHELIHIADWLSFGGVLIVSYLPGGLIDNWIESPLGEFDSVTEPITLDTDEAQGTVFEDAPITIPANGATGAVQDITLPDDATVLYTDATSRVVVFMAPVGAGWVIWLGWDWNEAAPVGSADGGWIELLEIAVTAALDGTL